MKRLSDEEVLKIGSKLENYHKCFYTFFEMAAVWMTDDDSRIPTAAVTFPRDDQHGKPELLLNESFWNSLTEPEQLFVVCHETLHVLLDHGTRNGASIPGATPALVNMAQDITINEMIIDPMMFKFDREQIRGWKRFCWIETCFPDFHMQVKRNETFLYYLDLLIKNPPPDQASGGPSVLDVHNAQPVPSDASKSSTPGTGTSIPDATQEQKAAQKAAAEKIAEDLNVAQIEALKNAIPDKGAGTIGGTLDYIISKKLKPAKVNFPAFIKNLKRSSMKMVDHDIETFVADSRRFNSVIVRRDVALPGSQTIQKPKPGLLLSAVFMDISGSCMEYFTHFQKIARAFEVEKKTFQLRLFTFDTAVKEVTANDRSGWGFGGTRFDIIEKKCLELETEYKRYPDCVIIVTDGDGTPVSPKLPHKWVWMLTPYANKNYIHKKSRAVDIKNVVF